MCAMPASLRSPFLSFSERPSAPAPCRWTRTSSRSRERHRPRRQNRAERRGLASLRTGHLEESEEGEEESESGSEAEEDDGAEDAEGEAEGS